MNLLTARVECEMTTQRPSGGLIDKPYTSVIERTGRGKLILSRRFYAHLGEAGVHKGHGCASGEALDVVEQDSFDRPGALVVDQRDGCEVMRSRCYQGLLSYRRRATGTVVLKF